VCVCVYYNTWDLGEAVLARGECAKVMFGYLFGDPLSSKSEGRNVLLVAKLM
jgi:hypothetical protein